jgi:hypothetical protein
MRIVNDSTGSLISGGVSTPVQPLGSDDKQSAAAPSGFGADHVSLSSGNGLVSLAKGLTPPDRQAKLASLASQVRSGQYKPNLSDVSRAIVNGLANG